MITLSMLVTYANNYIVDCGDPDSPANGDVSYTTTTEGSVADYSCDEGYDLNGVTQRICQSNNTWSGDVPTCESKQ